MPALVRPETTLSGPKEPVVTAEPTTMQTAAAPDQASRPRHSDSRGAAV
jgi:hypothetical protein